MCGIIAVLLRPSGKRPPAADDLRRLLRGALDALPAGDLDPARAADLRAGLATAADRMRDLDTALLGERGVLALRQDGGELAAEIDSAAESLQRRLDALENALDAGGAAIATTHLEELNATLVRLKDATWSVARDRLRTYRAVVDLAGPEGSSAALRGYLALQTALSALDRLEVRGRDSAGLHVYVCDHGLDLEKPALRSELLARGGDPLFGTGSVRVTAEGHLSFVYKAAAEIGELGDNTRTLRDAIRADPLLRRALHAEGARATVLGHTRWASVGIVSQANAHPLNQEELGGDDGPYVVAALNGDVDNYADLKASAGLRIAPEITTDAKVIPVLIARRLRESVPPRDAFRTTVASFEGSVAIAAAPAQAPDTLLLALRGSGQALYVGLAEDTFVVASEPYGVVEDCLRYVRMDGETPGNPANPDASRGQILVLRRDLAGELGGIERSAYDGTPLPLEARDELRAKITTRDIDRGSFPHFLLKEITESPRSLHKTLRGRTVESGGKLRVQLGEESLPQAVRERLRRREIQRIYLIGQGTAAVAGQGAAAAFEGCLRRSNIHVRALPATELSGFAMREDMRDTLIVAISQSGTTTDTNRTVDLVRQRGAAVLSIVNRRGSDLCDKSDGVLFTSDGRDVEMSVASTKAFYAQIAAGFLLAFAVARELGFADDAAEHDVLHGLRELPAAMRQVLERAPQIAQVARRHMTKRRYWALVGNGANRVAAQEIRIKLSELCYKAIPCDATEDKKHIDLSSEPLVLVCAAGLTGSTADDVGKEVAIYKAHKGLPLVIATDGEDRYRAAADVIHVPPVHPRLAFVLTTVAGHLLGYHAALAIDATARPLRQARAAIEGLVSGLLPHDHRGSDQLLAELAPALRPHAQRFFQMLVAREYDGTVEASTATRLTSLLRFALGDLPLEAYESAHGATGTPAVVIEELTLALTRAIEELTRPVDAIKHQAKTVTVGISRSDEALLTVPTVQELLAAGAPRDHVRYADLRTLAALAPAVRKVLGFTRYRIDGDADGDAATVQVIGRGGVARELRSRTEREPLLRGTKHAVARKRRLLVARGASDGRTVILVPEVHGGKTVGITLLHVAFQHQVPADAMHSVLHGYHDRLAELRDAVTETEPSFDEARLGTLAVADLLCESPRALAKQWRAG
ncbi:MAG: SIS domain-containing protein [Planctomycetota bacterium]